MNKLLSIINTVLANRQRNVLTSISAEQHLRNDLGFDSLDLAELTVRIESAFDIDIFENGIVTTVGEILDLLPNE